MKKIVDSNFDESEVVETKPLEKPTDTNVKVEKKSSNNTVIIISIVLIILAMIGFMVWNHVQNAKKNA